MAGLRRDHGLRTRVARNGANQSLDVFCATLRGHAPTPEQVGTVAQWFLVIGQRPEVWPTWRHPLLDPEASEAVLLAGLVFFPALVEVNPATALYRLRDPARWEQAAQQADAMDAWTRRHIPVLCRPTAGLCRCWDCVVARARLPLE